MGRTTTLGMLVLLLIGSHAFSQQPALPTPEDAYTSRDLIAWSQLQTPQPAPQPLPPRGAQVPQPEQPQDQQPKSPTDPHTQQQPLSSYTGVIVRESNRYFLSGSNNTTYQLDSNDELRAYENQNVRIVGTINPSEQTIKVLRVDEF